jgi:hypothetical protein
VRDQVSYPYKTKGKIMVIFPGLNTEHWKVLDRQSEPKGQRLILHIDQDSLVAIKSTGYKIFTGNCQSPERSRSTTRRSCARHSVLEVSL